MSLEAATPRKARVIPRFFPILLLFSHLFVWIHDSGSSFPLNSPQLNIDLPSPCFRALISFSFPLSPDQWPQPYYGMQPLLDPRVCLCFQPVGGDIHRQSGEHLYTVLFDEIDLNQVRNPFSVIRGIRLIIKLNEESECMYCTPN